MTHKYGVEHLGRGLEIAIASADKAEDIASHFATTYDQTILSLVAGMLLHRPPLSISQSSTEQVTRLPLAPLLTLIILDLTYAFLGAISLLLALRAVRRGNGVRDTQARRSTPAVVAESFESPAWGDDARDIDMLFAERRGEPTRRIALAQRKGGGRKFKQVVVPSGNQNPQGTPQVKRIAATEHRQNPSTVAQVQRP
ncbi:MAG: hypothetical protein Q9222_004815 [Ikaeria aurantiellina]